MENTANYIVNCERLNLFFLRLGTRQNLFLFFPLLINIVLGVLATILGQEKRNERSTLKRKK